jgi:Sec-independent protein secretion pathway component TatC
LRTVLSWLPDATLLPESVGLFYIGAVFAFLLPWLL